MPIVSPDEPEHVPIVSHDDEPVIPPETSPDEVPQPEPDPEEPDPQPELEASPDIEPVSIDAEPVPVPEPEPATHTVTFNTDGGSEVLSVNVSSGSTVDMPEIPEKAGYVFAGWYKDTEYTEMFTFGTEGDTVTQDITLYALWLDPDVLLANYALSEIAIGYSNGDNPNYVTSKLNLPAKVYTANFYDVESIDIVWSSDNPSVISETGDVIRQIGSDVNVTLKALIPAGDVLFSRDFRVRVVRITSRNADEIPTITSVDIAAMNEGDDRANISYGNYEQIVDIDGTFCGFKIFNAEDAQDAVHGIHTALGIKDTYSELVFDGASSMDTGIKYCFIQSYDNSIVSGRRVLVSTNGNNTNFMMSSFLSSDILARSDLTANITKGQAETIAKGYYSGSFDVISELTHQIIYSLDDYESAPVRAFAVRVLGITEDGRFLDENVTVNALNGEIIDTISNNYEIRAVTTAENELGVSVDFPVESELDFSSMSIAHFMRDSEFNVQVFKPSPVVDWLNDNLPDWLKNLGSSIAQIFMVEAVKNTWDAQQVSAYTNMIDIMRWWKREFRRNSLNDMGMKVEVVTHAKGDEENAAWQYLTQRINIYDNRAGTSKIHSLAAAADVLAHETTHAVIYYTISGGGLFNNPVGNLRNPLSDFAGVVYADYYKFPNRNATGAINEAYADIFACIYDSKDWTIAEDSYPQGKCMRNIAEPNSSNANTRLDIKKYFTVGQVYHEYKTVTPSKGDNDNNWVHRYSLIVSHAAYLMHKYGMPYDLLGKLWYSTIYDGAYDATSNFHSVRDVVLDAAREHPDLQDYIGIIEKAFDEVGISEDGIYYTLNITVSDDKDIEIIINPESINISRDDEIITLQSKRPVMLRPGKYILSINDSLYFPFSQEIELSCDTTINTMLSHVPNIYGVVYSSDKITPLENASMSIVSGRDNPNGDVIDSTTTGSDGYYEFTLSNQTSGDYTIIITKDGQTDYFSATIDGMVNKDWYFFSDNAEDVPVPTSPDILQPVSPDTPIVAESVPIDEAHFPDEIFRIHISENIDTNNDGLLSEAEIAIVTRIPTLHSFSSLVELYGGMLYGCSSLQGIEYFTALRYLGCAGNQLTTLDISNNIALETLRCENTSLMTLDLSNNTELQELDCRGNQLTSLDVSHNTKLQALYCYENQLATLDLSNNTELQKLDCDKNQLTSLNVSRNTKLQALYCYENQLATLDISNNAELQELDCYKNQLTTLDISNNTALKYLNCAINQLTTLDLSKNTALYELKCKYNQLTKLDISNCLHLSRHDVSYDEGVNVIWYFTTSTASLHPSDDGIIIIAVLPEFTPDHTGTYTFSISLDAPVPEGTTLALLADSRDIPCTFLNDEGQELTMPATEELDHLNISAQFTSGRTYSPVVTAEFQADSNGGCNLGFYGIIIILTAGIILTKKH